MNRMFKHKAIKRLGLVSFALALVITSAISTNAHPLGNFTVNHFSRLEISADRLRVHYVVDLAEISTFQELQTADTDGDGQTSPAELNAYLERVAPELGRGIDARVAGAQVMLNLVGKNIATQTGAGGLQTLRIECDYEGEIPVGDANTARRVRFENRNHPDRLGWREIVVIPGTGISVYDSNAFGNSLTDELRKYPEDMLAAPLAERTAELSFSVGPVPSGAVALRTRNGQPLVQSRDRLAELISIPKLTPWMVLLGLLIAAGLGALHALSPGHGKTVVGAYLVGSRGTARHAVFLGMTVTITHTLGVFALGLVTLFASRYVLPERLFPILSLISGAIVVVIGATLFFRRVRAALGLAPVGHHHHRDHKHGNGDHTHGHVDGDGWHSHEGGPAHSHLPPGADGERVTWRSLLGLGISGGLLPCPSALVVLLSAIALHRVGYGMVLVLAFSLGLATTLTVIGLLFVCAGRLLKERTASVTAGRLAKVLPAFSALVITTLGAAICYEAVVNSGIRFATLFSGGPTGVGTVSTASVLALGLVFGLKHAMEADHLAAVSTIVSERKSLLSSTLVGGLWGVGHTISLLIAGLVVIVLHVQIGERLALALEFCVALMLVTLGINAINKLRRGGRLHFHSHQHGGREHVHPHLHVGKTKQDQPPSRVGARPLIVGMIHGLAGSAALMLLVLSTIPSPLVGMVYIIVFGAGSIGGMMLMSGLVGLPLRLTANRFVRANLAVRGLAGVFSLGFGLFMVYQIGFVDGLFR